MVTPTCRRCGAPLLDGPLGGACPACLLRGAITNAAALPAVLDRIGKYRLLELLGQGGMGQVYLCEQEDPIRRRAALKIIKHGMDTEEVIARFAAERQALALMEHPNIARVFDAGTSPDGRPFFVMEYVPGIPLTDYCDRHRLGTDARLRLFLSVCDAIQHAHHKGVIHRDLKPSNVLVMVQEERPVPKVIDFGIAKAVHGRIIERTLFTRHGLLVGTPEYMSPEQAESDSLDVDTRTDIYSLGVILYELLIGMLPFDAARLRRAAYDEIQRIIRQDEPPRPSRRLTDLGTGALAIAEQRHTDVATLQKELRGDLDWVTLKAMEKDRTRRYPSASELSADITRHLKNEPVIARPQSAIYRIQKFGRRHKVLATSIVTIGTAIASAAVISTLFYWRAEQARLNLQASLVNAYVSRGMRLVQDGHQLAALPWLVQALKLEVGGAEREEVHRVRIGAIVRHAPQLIRVWEHEKDIYSVRFSKDGRLVATASADQTARVWDVATGKPVTGALAHKGEVMTVEFSATGDRVVTASTDGTARIWDVRTSMPIAGPLQHGASVYRAAFGADDEYVVTASADRTARLWSAVTGLLVATLKHEEAVRYASFSEDGREIVTASFDGTARRWLVPTGDPIGYSLDHWPAVTFAAFSPDDRQILTNGMDGFARLWDRETHRLIAHVRHERMQMAAYNADGSRFVTAGNDKTARIWRTAMTHSDAPVVVQHEHVVIDAAFQPRGTRVATGTADGKVHLWDSTTGRPVGTTLHHVGAIRTLRFDPTGRYLVTAGRDAAARLWDLAPDQNAPRVIAECADAIAIRFSDDGDTLAGSGRCSQLWDARTGAVVTASLGRSPAVIIGRAPQQFSQDLSRVLVIPMGKDAAEVWNVASAQIVGKPLAPGQPLTAASISPDGHLAVTGTGNPEWFALLPGRPSSNAGEARLWDVDRGIPIGEKMPHDDTVTLVIFRPDARQIATVTAKGAVRIWDSRTGRPVSAKLQTPYTGAGLTEVAFSSDNERFATGGDDGTVQVWNTSGRLLASFVEHNISIRRLAFSADSSQLLSASVDGTARRWDLRSGKQQGPPLQHGGYLFSAAFSPDGRWILTGSDNSSRVWDARTGALVMHSLLHTRAVVDVAFAPDNRRFATASGDIRIWQLLPDTRPLEELEALGQLLGGFRVDGNVPVPLTIDEIRREWNRVSRSGQRR